MFNFLICDGSLATYKDIGSIIEGSLADVDTYYCESLTNWSQAFLSQFKKKQEQLNSEQAENLSDAPAFDGTEAIEIIISAGNGSLVQVPSYTSSFLGFEFGEFRQELFWRSKVHGKDKEHLAMFITNLRLDGKKTRTFRFVNSNSKFNYLRIDGEYLPGEENESTIHLKLTDVTTKTHEGQELVPQIDIIMLEAKQVFKNPHQQISAVLQEAAKINGGREPSLFVLGHEDSDVEAAENFIVPAVTDYFYKPLDRLLLLEKITSHMPDIPRMQEEPFLFSSEVEFKVEVSQEQEISAMSDFGLKIKCPFPIRPGATVKMYSHLFGQNNRAGVWAVCYRNEKEGSFHNNEFSWYGIQDAQLNDIKSWFQDNLPADKVISDQDKLNLIEEQKKKKKKGPVVHGAGPKKEKKRHVVVIDLDQESIDELKEILVNRDDSFEIHNWGSVHQAAKELFPKGDLEFPSHEADLIDEGKAQSHQVNFAERAAFSPDQDITFEVTSGKYEFQEFKDFPLEDSTLFGDTAKSWGENPIQWLDRVSKRDKYRLKDFLKFVGSGQKAEAKFLFVNERDRVHPIFIKAQFKDGGRITINMEDQTFKSRDADAASKTLDKIELVAVDHSFVNYKTGEWMNRFRALLKENELNPKKFPTALMLLGSPQSLSEIHSFAGFNSDGFFVKPVDRIRFLQFLEIQQNNGLTDPKFSLIRWAPTSHYVDLARPARASGMGEKGLTILNPKPVSIGALARFYHPSLLDDCGRGILARCYRSEKFEEQLFKCHFAFFGVKETQLKSIRRLWLSGDEIKKDMEDLAEV